MGKEKRESWLCLIPVEVYLKYHAYGLDDLFSADEEDRMYKGEKS